jgi:hypothetical protein
MQAPAGTLISFAAAPGERASDGTGSDRPCTEALAKAIRCGPPPVRLDGALADRKTPSDLIDATERRRAELEKQNRRFSSSTAARAKSLKCAPERDRAGGSPSCWCV